MTLSKGKRSLTEFDDKTYQEDIKDRGGGDFASVIIGDEKQPDAFCPRIKVKRWEEEHISVGLTDLGGDVSFENGVANYTKGNVGARFYPKSYMSDPWGLGTFSKPENGGTEFDILLYRKPAVSYVDLSVVTDGLTLHKQKMLTLDEAWDEERQRQALYSPPNVQGGFAVYGNKKGGKYRNGKAFQIYRALMTDALGNSDWAVMSQPVPDVIRIDGGEFLETAAYPVVIDPYFGYMNDALNSLEITDLILAYNVSAAGIPSQVNGLAYGAKVAGSVPGDFTTVRCNTYEKNGAVTLIPNAESDEYIMTQGAGVPTNARLAIPGTKPVFTPDEYMLAIWGSDETVGTNTGRSYAWYDNDATNGEEAYTEAAVYVASPWYDVGVGWETGPIVDKFFDIWMYYGGGGGKGTLLGVY